MDEQMSLLLTHETGPSGFNREAGVVISSFIPNIDSQRVEYSLHWAEVSTTISGKIQNINFKDIEHKTIPHICSCAWIRCDLYATFFEHRGHSNLILLCVASV